MSGRRVFAIAWSLGAFALMLWGWMTYSGPYRWAAEWQLAQFGSYTEKITLFGPLIVLLIPAGLIGGWGPLLPAAVTTPQQRVGNARRIARVVAMLGVVALLVGAAGGGLGYRKMQTPLTRADLVLTNGAEPWPNADLVKVSGIARTDLIVVFSQTMAGSSHRWTFMPIVAPSWRAGDPVRFILRTNQNAWLPSKGAVGSFPALRMLERGTPPFPMVTEPSVLKHRALPGIVEAEYEKGRIPLDPSVAVVEQSAGEVYAPYWMTAFGGGLVGLCLLLVAWLTGINARRLAKA